MSKQESVGDWMELAKAYDKAEKETVEPYVIVTIEDRTTNEVLHRYNLPRYMFWKYDWVIRWRMSILENRRREYKESKQNELFFDESTDPILAKLRCKIASYDQKRDELEQLIKEKVQQVQKESGENPRTVCGSARLTG